MVDQRRGNIHFTYTVKALASKKNSGPCRSHGSQTLKMSAVAARSVRKYLRRCPALEGIFGFRLQRSSAELSC